MTHVPALLLSLMMSQSQRPRHVQSPISHPHPFEPTMISTNAQATPTTTPPHAVAGEVHHSSAVAVEVVVAEAAEVEAAEYLLVSFRPCHVLHRHRHLPVVCGAIGWSPALSPVPLGAAWLRPENEHEMCCLICLFELVRFFLTSTANREKVAKDTAHGTSCACLFVFHHAKAFNTSECGCMWQSNGIVPSPFSPCCQLSSQTDLFVDLIANRPFRRPLY